MKKKTAVFITGIFHRPWNRGIISQFLFFTLNYSSGSFISWPIKIKILLKPCQFEDQLSVLMNYIDYITLTTLQSLQHIAAEGPERPRVLKNEKEIMRGIFKFKKRGAPSNMSV